MSNIPNVDYAGLELRIFDQLLSKQQKEVSASLKDLSTKMREFLKAPGAKVTVLQTRMHPIDLSIIPRHYPAGGGGGVFSLLKKRPPKSHLVNYGLEPGETARVPFELMYGRSYRDLMYGARWPQVPPGMLSHAFDRELFRAVRAVAREFNVQASGHDIGERGSMVLLAPDWYIELIGAAERAPKEKGRPADRLRATLRQYGKEAIETVYNLRGAQALDPMLEQALVWNWAEGCRFTHEHARDEAEQRPSEQAQHAEKRHTWRPTWKRD